MLAVHMCTGSDMRTRGEKAQERRFSCDIRERRYAGQAEQESSGRRGMGIMGREGGRSQGPV